jgi:uncharacterized membrane protein
MNWDRGKAMTTFNEILERHLAAGKESLAAKKAYHGLPTSEFDGMSSQQLREGITSHTYGQRQPATAPLASPGMPELTGKESAGDLQRRDQDAQAYAASLLAKPASALTPQERAWLAQAVRESGY